MKSATVISLLLSLLLTSVAALPTAEPGFDFIESRQATAPKPNISNELINGNPRICPGTIFIFARGSTETGNMGFLGPLVADGLRSNLKKKGVWEINRYKSDLWVQGVGGDYLATIEDNFLPDGTSRAAIEEMKGLMYLAWQKCGFARLLLGGYSQGAALVAAAISESDKYAQLRVNGVVLFGYTKNAQNNGQIPGLPSCKLRVLCNEGDVVCEGQLAITPAHLAYTSAAQGPAVEFLYDRARMVKILT